MRKSRRKQVQQQNHQRWMAFVENHGDAFSDVLCAQPTADLAPTTEALRTLWEDLENSNTIFSITDMLALFVYLFNARYQQMLTTGVEKDALNSVLLQWLAPYPFKEGGEPALRRALQLGQSGETPAHKTPERRTGLIAVTVVCTHAMLPKGGEREWISEQLAQIPADLGL